MNEVNGDDNWNLDTLLDILKTEVEAREKCIITSRKQYSKEVPNRKRLYMLLLLHYLL